MPPLELPTQRGAAGEASPSPPGGGWEFPRGDKGLEEGLNQVVATGPICKPGVWCKLFVCGSSKGSGAGLQGPGAGFGLGGGWGGREQNQNKNQQNQNKKQNQNKNQH